MGWLPDSAPTICGRFVNEMAARLPRGPALGVVRASTRFEEAPRTLGAESRRLYALVNRALRHWGAAAALQGGGEAMHQGLLSLGSIIDRNSAAYNAHRLNGYRRWLERPDSARAGEAPAAREVLLAVEKALQNCAQHDELAVPESERLLATHWCARALTVAFMAGFVTSAPDEASAATDAIVSTR